MGSPVQFLSYGSFHRNCFIIVKLGCILSMYVLPIKHMRKWWVSSKIYQLTGQKTS